MIFQVVIPALLLVSAAVEAAEGDVKFWMDKVELHCPNKGEWYKSGGNKPERVNGGTFKYEYKGTKDQYHCNYKDASNEKKTYYFYIQGKACKNCFELDGFVFAVVIVADVIGTVLVMTIVFNCTSKKTAGPRRATRSAHPTDHIPLNSDYAPLNPHTRSSEYSTVINRTG